MTATDSASDQDQPAPAAAAKTDSPAAPSDAATTTPPDKRPGNGLAVLAVVVALAALGGAGFAVWQVLQMQSLPETLRADAAERARELEAELAARERTADDLADRLAAATGRLDNIVPRLERAEAAIAGIPGINQAGRAEFLKREALYYMRIANAQAMLAGNAEVALSALQLADEKLRDAADPALAPVREKLSEEIAALRALPEVDQLGVIFGLRALATQVDDWRFRNAVPERFANEIPAGDPDAADDPWQRLQDTVRSVFGSIVSVKRTDAPHTTQLGAAEEAIVIESVRAELQVARLAFVGGNLELFRESLGRTRELVTTYFDTDAKGVAAAVQTLTEFEAVELPGRLPDISGSLSLMLAAREAAAAATP